MTEITLSRRGLMTGFAALSATALLPINSASASATVPWVQPAVPTSSFLGTITHKPADSLMTMFLRTRKLPVEENEEYPPMSISLLKEDIVDDDKIDSIGQAEYNFLHRSWESIDSCDVSNIDLLKIKLNKLSNNIAVKTRRGKGNNIVVHPILEDLIREILIDPSVKLHVSENCPKNKIVCFYSTLTVRKEDNKEHTFVDGPMAIHIAGDQIFYQEIAQDDNMPGIEDYVQELIVTGIENEQAYA